jgi:leucyl/phenylalanyl-tRNA---protein transferase
MRTDLSADLLTAAYAAGVFPMAYGRDDPEIHWVDPERRGILPLDGFHVSRSLRRRILSGGFGVTIDTEFDGVVAACADRAETWINAPIRALYSDLHRSGIAHSVELRDAAGALVGGVYGVTLGAAFFGESMFSRVTDGSKIALAHTVHRLRTGGFRLFDTQFLTPHLASLGAVEVPRAVYLAALRKALTARARFDPPGYSPSPSEVASSAG